MKFDKIKSEKKRMAKTFKKQERFLTQSITKYNKYAKTVNSDIEESRTELTRIKQKNIEN